MKAGYELMLVKSSRLIDDYLLGFFYNASSEEILADYITLTLFY
jgi:hypothetical protein